MFEFEYSRIPFSMAGKKNIMTSNQTGDPPLAAAKMDVMTFPLERQEFPKSKPQSRRFSSQPCQKWNSRGAGCFFPAAMFAVAKVIIPLRGLLPLFRSAMSSPCSGRHIAAQIAGKGSAEARGIDYDAYVKDQRSEGSMLPLRCCSFPMSASTRSSRWR